MDTIYTIARRASWEPECPGGNYTWPLFAQNILHLHTFLKLKWKYVHCKAGEANTILKTASCETGPGTTLTYSYESYIWRLLIQEFFDGCCCPNSNLTYQSVICTMIIWSFLINLARIEPLSHMWLAIAYSFHIQNVRLQV
jgi:hypothetical protein